MEGQKCGFRTLEFLKSHHKKCSSDALTWSTCQGHGGLSQPEVQGDTSRRGHESPSEQKAFSSGVDGEDIRALRPSSAGRASRRAHRSQPWPRPSLESGLRRTAVQLPGLAPRWPPPSWHVCAPWPCSNGPAAFEPFPPDLSAPRETLAHQDHGAQNLGNSKLHFFSCFKHLTFPNCLLQFSSLSQTSHSPGALPPALASPLPQLPLYLPWWMPSPGGPMSATARGGGGTDKNRTGSPGFQ